MNSDPWGGSEVQWFALAMHYAKQQKNVTCLVYDWQEKKNKLQALKTLGALVIYIPNKGRAKKNIFERLRFEWITRLQQKLFINKFDFTKYDYVVVNQGGFMEVTNAPWKKINFKLKKYCLTFHNYTQDFRFKKEKANLLKNWMQHAHVNLGDAVRVGTILEGQLDIKLTNFYGLVNPLTITKSINYTQFPDLANGRYKIIMLAQLDVSRKAQDNLINAIALGDAWKNRNVVFELYGSGNDFDYLNKLINELQLNEKVILKGNTTNVAEALQQSHLVLQITHKDAMPISVVEALSMSRAVVVSNVGDMPLWVQENYNGWVTPDASINSVRGVLETAWQQKNNWEQMGKNSFDLFQKKFPLSVEEEFDKLILKQ